MGFTISCEDTGSWIVKGVFVVSLEIIEKNLQEVGWSVESVEDASDCERGTVAAICAQHGFLGSSLALRMGRVTPLGMWLPNAVAATSRGDDLPPVRGRTSVSKDFSASSAAYLRDDRVGETAEFSRVYADTFGAP